MTYEYKMTPRWKNSIVLFVAKLLGVSIALNFPRPHKHKSSIFRFSYGKE